MLISEEMHIQCCGFNGFALPATGEGRATDSARCPMTYAVAACSLPKRKSAPSIHMRYRTMASFLAKATVGTSQAAAFGDSHRPALQTGKTLYSREHGMGCFVESATHHGITRLGDAPCDVDGAGLILSWRQAEVRTKPLRRGEACGIVDRRLEGECGQVTLSLRSVKGWADS